MPLYRAREATLAIRRDPELGSSQGTRVAHNGIRTLCGETTIRVALVAFSLAVWHLEIAAAQTLQRISSTPVCDRCRITIADVARIGTLRDNFSIRDITTAVVGSSSVFFAPLFETGRVGRFDLTTRAVTLIGRPGAGPGELRSVLALAVGHADSLTILSGGRFNLFTKEGRFVRTVSTTARGREMLRLPDGSVLLSAAIHTLPSAGHQLHLFGANGQLIRSFGELRDTARAGMSGEELLAYRVGATLTRTLAASASGFWSGHHLKYQIDRFDRTGRHIGSIVRDAPWFPPRRMPLTTSAWDAPPAPYFAALAEHGGLLWTAITVSDRDWKTQEPKEYVPARAKDTVIEVIDPRVGGLLATSRIDGVVVAIGNGLVITHDEDADGLMFLRVSRVQLAGR